METLSSREVYRNAWLTVREDEVLRSDGSSGTYGVVEKPDFGIVIPRDAQGGLWLVEQYRYPVGRRGWEFPQGSWGVGAGGSPEQLAAAELREETGLQSEELRHLGHLYQAYGYSNQGFDVYLATGLTAGVPDREASEGDMQHRLVAPEEFVEMVQRAEIVDGTTLAAYGLLLLTRA